MRPEEPRSRYDPTLIEYNLLARWYDRLWSFYIRATVRETLRRLKVEPGDRVLDVGCGTGALLQLLSRRHPGVRLAGVEPSREMLSISRRRLGESVDLREGFAETLPFGECSFEVIVSTSVLHYLRDPAAALREMRRVLTPGGMLVITDWSGDFMLCRICERFLKIIDPAHVRIYRETALRDLLETAGFAVIESDRYKIDWLWGMMTAVARKAAAQEI